MQDDQLSHWRGDFGDAYTDRSIADSDRIGQSMAFWHKVFECLSNDLPKSVLEIGANVGANLMAIRRLFPDLELSAIEPNAHARLILSESGIADVRDGSAQSLPFESDSVDLAFTAGVLIHVPPEDLLQSCSEIHRCSRKYILCSEYFSDQPETISYRGHDNLLFKRDFGSFYLDNFADLELIDYGFLWRRVSGLDNQTWWLFGRK